MKNTTQKNYVNLYFNIMFLGHPKRASTSISKKLFDLYVMTVDSEKTARKQIATLLELAPNNDMKPNKFIEEHILLDIVKPEILKRYYLTYSQNELDLEGDNHKQTDIFN